jgi:ubiquitin carboxyl-terminal hydrolase L3
MIGNTSVPEDAEEEVDYHYVCFIKDKNGRIIELDGDRKGPINRGALPNQDDDMLSEASTEVVRRYIEREQDQNIGFNLMALVREAGSTHSTV